MIRDTTIIIKIIRLQIITIQAGKEIEIEKETEKEIKSEKEIIQKREIDTWIDSNKKRKEEANRDRDQGTERIKGCLKEEDTLIRDHILDNLK